MRAAALIGPIVAPMVALGACGSSAHTPDATVAPDATSPDITGIDIVVSSRGVVAWVAFTGALANNGRFAAPGTCGGTSDAFTIAQSCFAGLDIDNVALYSDAGEPTPGNPYLSTHPTTATSMFSATDCGRSIEIPLHAGPFPVATNVAGTRAGQDVIVSWTTTAPHAIASLAGGFGEKDCNDSGASEHRFVNANAPVSLQASVQPLTAPEVTHTDLGDVRVWYGDRTDFTVP